LRERESATGPAVAGEPEVEDAVDEGAPVVKVLRGEIVVGLHPIAEGPAHDVA
jgi:hypothetical protein